MYHSSESQDDGGCNESGMKYVVCVIVWGEPVLTIHSPPPQTTTQTTFCIPLSLPLPVCHPDFRYYDTGSLHPLTSMRDAADHVVREKEGMRLKVRPGEGCVG